MKRQFRLEGNGKENIQENPPHQFEHKFGTQRWSRQNLEETSVIDAVYNKQLEEAEKLYTEWESVSPTGDTRIPNLLLAAYINNNNIEQARSFHEGIKPSYTSWELLTLGYLKQKQMGEAFDCFEKAVGNVKRWEPDEKLIIEMYGVLEEEGDVEGAEKLLVILRKVGFLTTEIYNMLLRTYKKAGLMPLVMAERMNKDNAQLDEETNELIRVTSKMRVGKIPSCLS